MSPRGRRIAFGLVVILVGTLLLSPLIIYGVSGEPFALVVVTELVLLAVGIGIAVSDPPAEAFVQPVPADPSPLAGLESSTYRGPIPPARRLEPITKASAKRLTIGVLAALVFTGAAIPFAVHLPRWIEVELVIGLWWAMWSVVLAVVAYRGAQVDDDHVPGGGPIVDMSPSDAPLKPKWSWLEGLADPEGCLILLVVGVAILGAWLVVELVVPAVFLLAYRGVMLALAKAHAANSRGDALRSTLSGVSWAALHTAPLAVLVAIVHALFTA
jgi:hypothetical protein